MLLAWCLWAVLTTVGNSQGGQPCGKSACKTLEITIHQHAFAYIQHIITVDTRMFAGQILRLVRFSFSWNSRPPHCHYFPYARMHIPICTPIICARITFSSITLDYIALHCFTLHHFRAHPYMHTMMHAKIHIHKYKHPITSLHTYLPRYT